MFKRGYLRINTLRKPYGHQLSAYVLQKNSSRIIQKSKLNSLFLPQYSFMSTYFRKITPEQMKVLYWLENQYEEDPRNQKAACKYFRELNRHGKHHTVVRLYNKYYDDYETSITGGSVIRDKIREQFVYAEDTIFSVKRAVEENEEEVILPDSSEKAKSTYLYKMIDFGSKAVYYMLLVYVGLILIGSIDFKKNDQMKFEIKKADEIETRLDDVLGIEEIKDEILNVIKMLKDPNKYSDKGAKLHKGIMLFGEPGVGKTLLARAIAGEAGVHFLYCTGSNFDEMFVGTGAKRVRELFKEAKKLKDCIIFIDEIDSLLSKSRRYSVEHSSSRGTINQILSEMDGFDQTDNILVIGATNHEGSLDPAAVRPGRFDKKIHVPSPDVNGRESIFKHFISKINHDDSINPRKLAIMCPGFTGAEIENLVNTAIAEAVHRGKTQATLEEFEYSRDRIMMGIERSNLSMDDRERIKTAIHESGHAIVCNFTKEAKKLYKVTIVARGGSLGATYMEPDESDSISMSKEKLLAQIDVAMGGHIAEKLVLGDKNITSGCGSDLQGATRLAVHAVRSCGMFGEEGASFISSSKNETSDEYNSQIDIRVKKILDESSQRVSKLLKEKDFQLRELSKNLYWHDYLDFKEVDIIMNGKKLTKEKVREWKSGRNDGIIM
jgi:ATP-dependent metalloprotease